MLNFLQPGYLRWDGTKFVTSDDVEIIGPVGPEGPEGPGGAAGTPGIGVGAPATGDLVGTYPSPISVVRLTGTSGTVTLHDILNQAIIEHAATSSNNGYDFTLKAQNASQIGGSLVLNAGNGSSNGGNVNIISGTGSSNGLISLYHGSNLTCSFLDSGMISFSNSKNNVGITQDSTSDFIGKSLTISSQTAADEGGSIILRSGSGSFQNGKLSFYNGVQEAFTLQSTNSFTTAELSNGYANFTFQMKSGPLPGNFVLKGRDSSLTDTPVLGGTISLVSGIGLEEVSTPSGIQLHPTSGNVMFVHQGDVSFKSYVTSYNPFNNRQHIINLSRVFETTITPEPTSSLNGNNLTIKGQDSTMSPSQGGSVRISGGQGIGAAGLVYIGPSQGDYRVIVGETNTAMYGRTVFQGSTTFTQSLRLNTRMITSNYTVSSSSDYIIIAGTRTINITVTLPTINTAGDTYIIKDGNGSANTRTITISGGAATIDDSGTYVINVANGFVQLVYSGSRWCIIGK